MNNESEKIVSFTDLHAWREGHRLVLRVYAFTRAFPKEELFGLVLQMRRCVTSITSNIAEGFGRWSYREKAQFYSIALGSVTELQNQLIIARDVGYVSSDEFRTTINLSITVHKLINGLIKTSRSKSHDSSFDRSAPPAHEG